MNVALTPVYLVGSLHRALDLPERLDLNVKSPAEAIRALSVITKGKIDAYLRGPARDKLYRVALQKRTNVIGKEELGNRSGCSAIYIMPTIRGRNSGLGKVLAGAALLAAVYFTGGLAAGAAGWAGAGATATAGTSLSFLGTLAVGFGTSLLLGGITQLLTPSAKGGGTSDEQLQSSDFAGNVSAVVQGNCVPVVYGRALVAAIPVAVSYNVSDVSTTEAGESGMVERTDLDGGGYQYDSTVLPN